MYEKQGFYSGQPLKASQLDAMEDGIIEAQKGVTNMEKGAQTGSTQQIPDGVANGIDFSGRNLLAATYDVDVKKWHDATEKVPYGATGLFAHSEGGKSAAIGKRAHAEGTTTIAKGDYSHAEGDNTVALGPHSHAEGSSTVAVGGGSHAEGNLTVAEGQFSHAEGIGSQALGSHSHAAGYYTKATKSEQYVVGRWNYDVPQDINKVMFMVGCGTSETDRQNAFEVYESGQIGIRHNGKVYSLQAILARMDNAFIDDNLLHQ